MATTKKLPKTISIKAALQSSKKSNQQTNEVTMKKTATTAPTATTQKPLTEKQILARERRKALKDLSNELKTMAEQSGNEAHVNDLLREFYAETGHTQLKTFDQWKAEGYFVRKGEKALLLWGKPTASKASKQTATEQGKAEEDAENDFYPLAYLFSQQQVTRHTQQ